MLQAGNAIILYMKDVGGCAERRSGAGSFHGHVLPHAGLIAADRARFIEAYDAILGLEREWAGWRNREEG